mmetsp:Transcript_32100/g.88485  ORF Transcript_32100/g.88485 Transcript_32100/m.88485 type:complete len:843 (+) Transcript_32100:100-2628(+)
MKGRVASSSATRARTRTKWAVATAARASCTRTRQPSRKSSTSAASSTMPRSRGSRGPLSGSGARAARSTAARKPSRMSKRGERHPANAPAVRNSSAATGKRAASDAAAASASAASGAAAPRRAAAARTSRSSHEPGSTATSVLAERNSAPHWASPEHNWPCTTISPQQLPAASAHICGASSKKIPSAGTPAPPKRLRRPGLAEMRTDRRTTGPFPQAGSAVTPRAAQICSPTPAQSREKSKKWRVAIGELQAKRAAFTSSRLLWRLRTASAAAAGTPAARRLGTTSSLAATRPAATASKRRRPPAPTGAAGLQRPLGPGEASKVHCNHDVSSPRNRAVPSTSLVATMPMPECSTRRRAQSSSISSSERIVSLPPSAASPSSYTVQAAACLVSPSMRRNGCGRPQHSRRSSCRTWSPTADLPTRSAMRFRSTTQPSTAQSKSLALSGPATHAKSPKRRRCRDTAVHGAAAATRSMRPRGSTSRKRSRVSTKTLTRTGCATSPTGTGPDTGATEEDAGAGASATARGSSSLESSTNDAGPRASAAGRFRSAVELQGERPRQTAKGVGTARTMASDAKPLLCAIPPGEGSDGADPQAELLEAQMLPLTHLLLRGRTSLLREDTSSRPSGGPGSAAVHADSSGECPAGASSAGTGINTSAGAGACADTAGAAGAMTSAPVPGAPGGCSGGQRCRRACRKWWPSSVSRNSSRPPPRPPVGARPATSSRCARSERWEAQPHDLEHDHPPVFSMLTSQNGCASRTISALNMNCRALGWSARWWKAIRIAYPPPRYSIRRRYGCLAKSRSPGGASAASAISGGTTGLSPRMMASNSCCAVASLKRGMLTI